MVKSLFLIVEVVLLALIHLAKANCGLNYLTNVNSTDVDQN